MSDDLIHVWLAPGCWLFGFAIDRGQVGICIGPLNISIMWRR